MSAVLEAMYKAERNALLADAPLVALVGTRIYDLDVPATGDNALPRILIGGLSDVPFDTFSSWGSIGFNDLHIWGSKEFAQSQLNAIGARISIALRAKLALVGGTMIRGRARTVIGDVGDPDETLVHRVMSYTATMQEA